MFCLRFLLVISTLFLFCNKETPKKEEKFIKKKSQATYLELQQQLLQKIKNIEAVIERCKESVTNLRLQRGELEAIGGFKTVPKNPGIEQLKEVLDSLTKKYNLIIEDFKVELLDEKHNEKETIKVDFLPDLKLNIKTYKEEMVGKINFKLILLKVKPKSKQLNQLLSDICNTERIINITKIEKLNNFKVEIEGETFYFKRIKLPPFKIDRCKLEELNDSSPQIASYCNEINKKLKDYRRCITVIIKYELEKTKLNIINEIREKRSCATF